MGERALGVQIALHHNRSLFPQTQSSCKIDTPPTRDQKKAGAGGKEQDLWEGELSCFL